MGSKLLWMFRNGSCKVFLAGSFSGAVPGRFCSCGLRTDLGARCGQVLVLTAVPVLFLPLLRCLQNGSLVGDAMKFECTGM